MRLDWLASDILDVIIPYWAMLVGICGYTTGILRKGTSVKCYDTDAHTPTTPPLTLNYTGLN